jgi:hypothetical protein
MFIITDTFTSPYFILRDKQIPLCTGTNAFQKVKTSSRKSQDPKLSEWQWKNNKWNIFRHCRLERFYVTSWKTEFLEPAILNAAAGYMRVLSAWNRHGFIGNVKECMLLLTILSSIHPPIHPSIHVSGRQFLHHPFIRKSVCLFIIP